MRTREKNVHDVAEHILSRDNADLIDRAEIVQSSRPSTAPISVRLSAPLLERIDRIAAREHRKRGNLIQYILWEYVRSHE